MEATTDAERTRSFIRDLEEAEGIYRRLLELTQSQGEILRGGVAPELLDLAREKEVELNRLGAIEARMATTRSDWPAIRERLPGDLRGAVQAVVTRVEAVLRQLLDAEEAEGRSLAEKRDATLAQIRRLDSARKVRGAYVPGSGPAPGLLDRKE